MITAWTRLSRILVLVAIILIGIVVASITMVWMHTPAPQDAVALLKSDTTAAVTPDSAAALQSIPFVDAAGHTVALKDFRGKVVVLNLWATWCPPCVREMPLLDRLQGLLGDEGLMVVALSTDQGVEAKLQDFFRRQRLEHLLFFHDRSGEMTRTLLPDGLPTTYILDRDGQIRVTHKGYLEWDKPSLIKWFREVLSQAG